MFVININNMGGYSCWNTQKSKPTAFICLCKKITQENKKNLYFIYKKYAICVRFFIYVYIQKKSNPRKARTDGALREINVHNLMYI